MRTGAIFARGSCRALKWMALFGVVFALGAGLALAQTTIQVKSVKIGTSSSGTATAQENSTVTVEITLDKKVPDAEPDADPATTTSVQINLTAAGIGTAAGEAEEGDIQIAGTDLTNTGRTGVITINEGSDKGSFEMELDNDSDAVDEAFSLTFAIGTISNGGSGDDAVTAPSPAAPKTRAIRIDDDETQAYEFDVEQTAANRKEGDAIDVELESKPDRPANENETVYVYVDGEDSDRYEVDPVSATFTSEDGEDVQEFTVDLKDTLGDSDGDREDDEITLSAFAAGANPRTAEPVATQDITVKDIHALPADDKITAKAFTVDDKGKKTKTEVMSVMEGGDAVVITVTVDRGEMGYPMGEDLEVTLMADSSQGLDFRFPDGSNKVTIGQGNDEQAADIKLEALEDDDVGAETLMFELVTKGKTEDNGPGQSTGMFSIMIEDATAKKVWVMDDAYDAIMEALGEDPLNPGNMVDIMTDDLFGVMEGYTASYAASVEGTAASASASGDKVMVMGEDAGEAKVTVTATATPMADSLIITQNRADVAQLTFPVMVELADLMITLSGPEDMNIAEGMSAMVTATTNRAVTEDTVVELIQTEGTASPADFKADPIMIMAGEMTGTTMVMAVEDEMIEDMEMLTIEGRAGDVKSNALMFYLWDAAVPALPLIAQLLLAGLLGLGGYRRYRRR